jgi:3-oxoacyl-[acyl-carrier protein] reductase
MHPDLAQTFSLAGRRAVITGAASGIAREAALTFAKAGAALVLADVNSDGLEETQAQAAALDAPVLARVVDVADREAFEALAASIEGGFDIWANVAAVVSEAPVTEMSEAELDRMLNVNLKGVYWGCAAAARVMAPRGRGSIINLSSAGADKPAPGLSVYSMTKAAVNMLTRTLAHEVGPMGVRVNAVAPGYIDTPMVAYNFRTPNGDIDAAKKAEVFGTRARSSVLGLIGAPSDIALMMLYLACDASCFVTGQIMRPNGGSVMP